VAVEAYLRPADLVAELLTKAGFVVHARLFRAPDGFDEKEQHVYRFASLAPTPGAAG